MNDKTASETELLMESALRKPKGIHWAVLVLAAAGSGWAGDLDTIGVTLLRQIDPALTGSGVRLAQPEAPESTSTPIPFEVNPSLVGQPSSLFTYISASGTATTYPNSVGSPSGHAGGVGALFYGPASGVATNAAHVDNYEAGYFYNHFVAAGLAISASIVNQSFIFEAQSAAVDQAYDNYAATRKTLFVSGVGNSGPPSSPATCFNGIGVGAYTGASSIGPTTNGNRCKPDITAPSPFGPTSFSTPYVAGAAAILVQAANRGDGGGNLTAANDPRTIKGLLLNGAIKPSGWTNGLSSPLDGRYGAGILNVFNSWKQLSGGQHAFIESTSNTSGGPHPPGTNPNNEPVLVGWDYNSIANTRPSGTYREQVNHYYFDLSPYSGSTFTMTATLVWSRQSGQSAINDLNLFLYDAGNASLVTCSTSVVDNVEHVFQAALPKGRYDLQVQKKTSALITASETYALAFEFFNLQLSITPTNNNSVRISWPISPAGFTLRSTTNLTPPVSWTTVNSPVSVVNSQNVVFLPATGGRQFLRLQRP